MNMLTTEYLKAATIKDLRHGFESESFSCEDLVRAYLRECQLSCWTHVQVAFGLTEDPYRYRFRRD